MVPPHAVRPRLPPPARRGAGGLVAAARSELQIPRSKAARRAVATSAGHLGPLRLRAFGFSGAGARSGAPTGSGDLEGGVGVDAALAHKVVVGVVLVRGAPAVGCRAGQPPVSVSPKREVQAA